MRYLLTLLMAGAAHAGTLHLAWDYPDDYTRLAGFEVRTSEMLGDLMTDTAIATTLTLDAASFGVQVVDGVAVGFESALQMPAGFAWVTVRAYIRDPEDGTVVYGQHAEPIRVMVTPSGIVQLRVSRRTP